MQQVSSLWNHVTSLLRVIRFAFSKILLHHLYYRANIRIDAENSRFFWPGNLFERHPRPRYKPRLISTCQRFTSTLGPFLSLRGKCHLKSWLVLTRKREKEGREEKAGANSNDSTAAVKTLPQHPSRRISCHRLHRSLSSPAMKQMIKASTRMLWMDRRIHPRIASCRLTAR